MATLNEALSMLGALNHDGDDCVFWPFRLDQWGSPVVVMPRNNAYGGPVAANVTKTTKRHKTRQYAVSVVVMTDGGRPRPSKSYEPAHTCGNKTCIALKHLVWRHRSSRSSRLTDQQKAEIRASSERAEVLAVKYDVSYALIMRTRRKNDAGS